ncbi:ferrous iron transport protein B [Nannocystaceae bacterium ST9]
MSAPIRIAVAGNPNVGKTSLFNLLTHSRYKVGNYPGITVETREGRLRVGDDPEPGITLIDLPGTYSLTPTAEDEAVAFRALTGADGQARPDAVLLVLDASNLARNLYLSLQVLELGLPCVVALNMVDLAEQAGVPVDVAKLGAALELPVVPTVARTGVGIEQAAAMLRTLGSLKPSARHAQASEEASELEARVAKDPARARWLLAAAEADALELTGASTSEREALAALGPATIRAAVHAQIEARYAEVDRLLAGVITTTSEARIEAPAMVLSAKIDRVLTHRVLGPLVFLLVMALVFQSLFSWADPLIGLIEAGIGWLADATRSALGEGAFTDLLTEGVIAGVGNVVVFVPQIALLFLFVGLLEDSGYMARAAFIVDRLMAKVGLNGKAFVPLLSGYACAIPAIMGTRTISGLKDRLVTILMIPFMSCSARLPVYTLVIGALFAANERVFGPFTQGGLILLGMYLLSTFGALTMGAIYKRTLLRSPTPPLVLELPPYRLPRVRDTARHVWDRTADFLRHAGTIILAVTVVLWGLLSYPKVDPETLPAGETAIEHSIAGKLGKAIEPVLTPIGQDWRIGIGLIGSFAAREVLVSTLGLVYGIEGDVDEDDAPLREVIREAKTPEGAPRYGKASGLALMVFFVFACQCMSTLAVVKRETASWRWPVFMLVSMTVIAYVSALLTFWLAKAFGL